MKTPTLGAVMIVKNEEKNLGGILSDIHGVVDELCIVDTGSSDGTIALAESFGARIEHFPWCDDFSAARNCSLGHASSDYLIWLDADDRIDGKDQEALRAIKASLSPGKDRAYMLKILSRSEDMSDTVSYQTRIVPNRDSVRFEGRVHEQILPSLKRSGIPVESLDITIRHTGYHDHAARVAKARRNLAILTEELREGKGSASQHFFMAMACIGMEDYRQCLEHLTRARQKRTDEDWLHFSYSISTECLLRLEWMEDALAEITKGTRIFRDSPLLHYYLGLVCTRAGRFAEGAAAFQKALALPRRIDSYPIPPDLGTSILLQYGKALEKTGRTGDVLDVYQQALKSGTRQQAVHSALGIALLQTGRIDDAQLHLDRAREMSPTVDAALWESLAQVYLFQHNEEKAHALFLDLLRNDPGHLSALVGVIGTSVALDDIPAFLEALEKLLAALGVPVPDAQLESLAECADLCMCAVARLRENGKKALARRLAEAALKLDPSSVEAHLFVSDLFAEEGDTARMAASLETALKCGADRSEIVKRIDRAKRTENL